MKQYTVWLRVGMTVTIDSTAPLNGKEILERTKDVLRAAKLPKEMKVDGNCYIPEEGCVIDVYRKEYVSMENLDTDFDL